MQYNRELFVDGVEKFSIQYEEYLLPDWEELPEFDLYMDQIISLLGQYLKIYNIYNTDEKIITASMINNYVKLKFMPAPIKKKYNRTHLAYLIIICSLKQTLAMSTIQKIIPCNLNEQEIIEIYKAFVRNQKKVLEYTSHQVKEIAQPITDEAIDNPGRIHDLLLQVAMFSNITKYLTEKMVGMQKNSDDK